jgi:hypothetical protein
LRLLSIAVCIFGFVFCFVAYYPGLLSPDSVAMLSRARGAAFSDWHSATMEALWAVLHRLVPGAAGMLALLLAFYWGALFLLTTAAMQIDRRVAPAMLVIGFMPFTINFAGTLWTDVLTATSWLMCAALVFSAEVAGKSPSMTRQVAWQRAPAWSLSRAKRPPRWPERARVRTRSRRRPSRPVTSPAG